VQLAGEIRARYPATEVILLTAYGNIPDGVQAIKNGAFDYIVKGDDNARLIPLLYQAVEKARQNRSAFAAAPEAKPELSFEQITGQSPAFLAAISLARKVAPTDTAVLLLGETGVGKEVFAQAIHRASRRSDQPLVAINCAAFSRELLESEMFGYKAGAFTGAVKDKKGILEAANGGTLFLDEIGEMSLELQARMLRVLETGSYFRVGDVQPMQTDVRVIAATHRDLKKEGEAGHFRQDLYYRLSVFEIHLPPLRERKEDIEALARHFTALFAAQVKRPPLSLHPDFVAWLRRQPWPGNIRELKNIIERGVILAEGNVLGLETLPAGMREPAGGGEAHPAAFDLAEVEKLHIQKVLRHTGGNKTEAARLLHIGLTTLYRKLEEYRIG
jgi:DNA-binding NtrC family response regulator